MTIRYSLRELEVFVAIASVGTVTAAANELAMTQSAASQALAMLEQNLQTMLFERIGRRLVLSAAGQRLLPKARALLDDAAQFSHHLGAPADLPLVIAASTTIANYLLPRALAGYLQQFPAAQVQLSVANTADIITQVADFKADIGLIEGPCHHPDLQLSPWQDDELVLFTSVQAKIPTRDTLAWLQQQPWVLREAGSGTRIECERLLLPFVGKFQQVLELGHSEAIKRTVAAGYGISCLSRHVIADALQRGELQEITAALPVLRRSLYLIRHRERQPSPACSRFLHYAQPPEGPHSE